MGKSMSGGFGTESAADSSSDGDGSCGEDGSCSGDEDAEDAEDTGLWQRVLEQLEIECAGSAEEFAKAEIVTENSRAHWVEGVRNAQKQIGLLLEPATGNAEIRMAAVLRESFEVASWKGREARLAAFVQDVMQKQEESADSQGKERVPEMTAEAQDELRELDRQLEAAQLEIERLQYNRAVVLQQCDVSMSVGWLVLRGAMQRRKSSRGSSCVRGSAELSRNLEMQNSVLSRCRISAGCAGRWCCGCRCKAEEEA
jgi:hypothetical protein